MLLVERGEPPFRGSWALPGGSSDGPAPAGPRRTWRRRRSGNWPRRRAPSCAPPTLSSSAATAHPGRDPRMRVVSVAYLAFAPELPEATAGTDAADAQWVPVGALGLSTAGGAVTQRPGTTPPARLRPRANPGRRAGAGPGQARVHAAGDGVRPGAVHDLRAPRGLRDRLGREAARGQLPPQGPVGSRVRRVHRRARPRPAARAAAPARSSTAAATRRSCTRPCSARPARKRPAARVAAACQRRGCRPMPATVAGDLTSAEAIAPRGLLGQARRARSAPPPGTPPSPCPPPD